MIHVHKDWTLVSINEALDSLKYGLNHIREYQRYPSYEYKQQRLWARLAKWWQYFVRYETS